MDCGGSFAPYVMDFEHRDPATKSFWILQRAGSVSTARLEAELAKCDIVCANCHRARTYARAMERQRARVLAGRPPKIESRLRREQTELIQHLREVPCADCGERFGFYAMDFDHRIPEDKTAEVPRLLGRVATARLLEEIAKCDIVCANCHRVRTHERRIAKLSISAGVL
jgi:Zn finger protein HypA/HybF involved in hydrogenase expression